MAEVEGLGVEGEEPVDEGAEEVVGEEEVEWVEVAEVDLEEVEEVEVDFEAVDEVEVVDEWVGEGTPEVSDIEVGGAVGGFVGGLVGGLVGAEPPANIN